MSATDPSHPLPQFVGKYKIVRMIARSNDIVYEAIDPHLGRHVALKELMLAADITGAAKRERIERFQREAKAAGALKHPNIVTIYEVGQHLEHRFIAMEYLEGQTLRETLNVGGPLSIKDALHIALQICDALGYAHAQGVVHRDTKPDNIHLIQPNHTVKITDFGIARLLSEPSITAAGQVFGTPSYMSPEQLTSRVVDHRTDIFSSAVVFYEMITGKKPFRGENVVAVTYQIMHSDPPMPPAIPAGIAAILTKALQKDPDMRYQSMRTFAGDLRKELAFHDSPRHVPTVPSGDPGGKTIVMAAAPGMSGQTGPVTGQGATMQMTSQMSGSSPTVYAPGHVDAGAHPTSVSLIAAIDGDENIRHAVLRLAGAVAGVAALLCITLWALVQFAGRFSDNSRHNKALGSYMTAVDQAASGDFASAIGNYRQALDTVTASDALFDRSRRGISDCYTAQGVQSQNRNDLTAAQESYNEAIAADFTSAVAHFDLAMLYEARGNQVDALREFSAARQGEPMSIAGIEARKHALEGYLQLGSQEFSQGNIGRARQNWQRVIDLDPSSSEADQARELMSQVGR